MGRRFTQMGIGPLDGGNGCNSGAASVHASRPAGSLAPPKPDHGTRHNQIAATNRITYCWAGARVAQLDRASASGAEGCGFDPRLAHQSSLATQCRAKTAAP